MLKHARFSHSSAAHWHSRRTTHSRMMLLRHLGHGIRPSVKMLRLLLLWRLHHRMLAGVMRMPGISSIASTTWNVVMRSHRLRTPWGHSRPLRMLHRGMHARVWLMLLLRWMRTPHMATRAHRIWTHHSRVGGIRSIWTAHVHGKALLHLMLLQLLLLLLIMRTTIRRVHGSRRQHLSRRMRERGWMRTGRGSATHSDARRRRRRYRRRGRSRRRSGSRYNGC